MNNMQLKKLLDTEETPLYIFDMDELQHRIHFLRKSLPEHVGLCYAVKSNTFILKKISEFVDRLEICSPGELCICQNLQLPSEKFVISGVYKEASLMKNLIFQKEEMGIYTVESMTQFSVIYNAAVSAGKHIAILLRLTSGNQFGLEKYEIDNIIKCYSNNPFIDIRGIQYFSGTQKTSLKRLKRELNLVDLFLEELYYIHGYQAKELEFGPGFPISYFKGEVFDEASFMKEFSVLLTEMKFKGKIILELGRSIAASCGSYLTRVVDMKCNHSQNYAIVDGGMHQLVYYGQSMAMKHPHVHRLSANDDGEKLEWNICGSLCTVNDILVKQLPLTGLKMGDVLVFENTGAYCMTEGISLFLSRNLPEIVLISCDGSMDIVRRHSATADLNTPNYERR